MTKTCTKCGQEKPLEEFRRNCGGLHGRQSRCKVCQREQEGRERQGLNASDFAGKVPAARIISPEEAAEMCRAKLGWAPAVGQIEAAARTSGRYSYLGEMTLSKTGSRLVLAGINRNRWLGLLNGRSWAKTVWELFGDGI